MKYTKMIFIFSCLLTKSIQATQNPNLNFNIVVESKNNASAVIKDIAGFKTAMCLQKDIFNNHIAGLAVAKKLGKLSLYGNTYDNNKHQRKIDATAKYELNKSFNLSYSIQQSSNLKKEYKIQFLPFQNLQLGITLNKHSNIANHNISCAATYTMPFGKNKEQNLFDIFQRNVSVFKVEGDEENNEKFQIQIEEDTLSILDNPQKILQEFQTISEDLRNTMRMLQDVTCKLGVNLNNINQIWTLALNNHSQLCESQDCKKKITLYSEFMKPTDVTVTPDESMQLMKEDIHGLYNSYETIDFFMRTYLRDKKLLNNSLSIIFFVDCVKNNIPTMQRTARITVLNFNILWNNLILNDQLGIYDANFSQAMQEQITQYSLNIDEYNNAFGMIQALLQDAKDIVNIGEVKIIYQTLLTFPSKKFPNIFSDIKKSFQNGFCLSKQAKVLLEQNKKVPFIET